MVGRQLREEKYRGLQEDLFRYARNTPLCPIQEVDLVLNGEAYTLFLLTERHNKVYALYALHSVYEKAVSAVNHDLITDNVILSALMELVIYQGVTRRTPRARS